MRNNKDLTKLLIVFCTLTIVATGLVAFVTSVSWLPVSTDNAWIGYYGGIIGSIATLLGVVVTLRENRKQEQENLEMQYKPILITSFRWNQGLWTEEENKQLINGNFNDCISLCEEDVKNGIGFSTEIMLESATGVAQNVMFEVYVDGVKKYEKNNDMLIAISKSPFYYYVHTYQRDLNEEHKVVVKIYYRDIFEKQYQQEVIYRINQANIENVEVKSPKMKNR